MPDTLVALPPFEAGFETGNCRLVERLGEGSFAQVWKAVEIATSATVALKILNLVARGDIKERFVSEMTTMRGLRHPNIVAAYALESFEDNWGVQRIAIVMEYIDGAETLRDRMSAQNASTHELLQLMKQLLDALKYAHSMGVIHRDLKPENILLKDGNVMLTDFGIAYSGNRSENAARKTQDGQRMGTVEYMPFEAWVGANISTFRSDLFAVGIMLAELCGVAPMATTPEKIADYVNEEKRRAWLGRIPHDAIRDIVEQATRNEWIDGTVVERRYANAGLMLADVEATMAQADASAPAWTLKGRAVHSGGYGTPIPEEAESDDEPTSDWKLDNAPALPKPASSAGRRRLALTLVALIAASVLIVGGVVVFTRSSAPEHVTETPPDSTAEAQVVEAPPTEQAQQTVEAPDVEPEPEGVTAVLVPIVETVSAVTLSNPAAEAKGTPPTPIRVVEEMPEASPAAVTEPKVTINHPQATVASGQSIAINAMVILPEGAVIRDKAIRWRGEGATRFEKAPLNINGTTATGTLQATPVMGAQVEYYVDVRLVGSGEAFTSSRVTTTIE